MHRLPFLCQYGMDQWCKKKLKRITTSWFIVVYFCFVFVFFWVTLPMITLDHRVGVDCWVFSFSFCCCWISVYWMLAAYLLFPSNAGCFASILLKNYNRGVDCKMTQNVWKYKTSFGCFQLLLPPIAVVVMITFLKTNTTRVILTFYNPPTA